MPRVVFTHTLQRHVAAPPTVVEGASVREALERVFERNARLRGYVLDDQGELRPDLAVFVNGASVKDRVRLSDAVGADAEIYVMQALSGG